MPILVVYNLIRNHTVRKKIIRRQTRHKYVFCARENTKCRSLLQYDLFYLETVFLHLLATISRSHTQVLCARVQFIYVHLSKHDECTTCTTLVYTSGRKKVGKQFKKISCSRSAFGNQNV